MARSRLLPLTLFLAGVLVLGYAFAMGQLNVALFLIFPVFYGTGLLPLLGMLLLMAAFFTWVFSGFRRMAEPSGWDAYQHVPGGTARDPGWRNAGSTYDIPGSHHHTGGAGPTDAPPVRHHRRVRGGGLIMLGPIPIVFGSDKGIAKGLLVLGIVLTLLMLLLFLLASSR